MARRTASGTGGGDVCPIDRSHGQMLVLNGNVKQYCPHQSHDGRFKSNPNGSAPATRNLWPMQFFAKAVEEYTATTAGEAVSSLPDIDMEAFNA